MAELTVATVEGGAITLEEEDLAGLRAELRGDVLTPRDAGYDRARAVWNATVERRPSLIVRCGGTADVMRTVAFARQRDLLVAIRGGGHNIAGLGTCEGGLLLDLSRLRDVRVDPRRRTARVAAGATLADLDGETQAFGLATPLGINSTTGVAGLTLGGGFGWLSRKLGLTVDNLLSADVVTADAGLVQASERNEPDLFWAIRGGGGNFGVVTSFELKLHRVGPQVLAGLIVHPLEGAERLLEDYRDVTAAARDDLSCWLVLRKAPPLPFLPAEHHGREVVVMAVLWIGGSEAGERQIRTLRRIGKPVAVAVGPQRYVDWQRTFDPLLAAGSRNYWKSHNFSAISEGAINTVLDFAARLPTAQTEIFLAQLGGAASRPAPDATAYPHRDANFVLNVHARWEDPADDGRCTAWARDFFQASAPFSTGGVYVNFVSEGEQRVRAAFGSNFDRLATIKARYDPDNFFRVNQNIPPRPAVEEPRVTPPEAPIP